MGERGYGTEDQAMVGAVKILLGDAVGYRIPGFVVKHKPTEHRLFGLYGMGWDPQRPGDFIWTVGQFFHSSPV